MRKYNKQPKQPSRKEILLDLTKAIEIGLPEFNEACAKYNVSLVTIESWEEDESIKKEFNIFIATRTRRASEYVVEAKEIIDDVSCSNRHASSLVNKSRLQYEIRLKFAEFLDPANWSFYKCEIKQMQSELKKLAKRIEGKL